MLQNIEPKEQTLSPPLFQEPLSGSGLPMTPMGTLDLSLPKKPDPSVLEQFVSPGALVPESSVLKVGEIFCLEKIFTLFLKISYK